jgi:hypothetical protein
MSTLKISGIQRCEFISMDNTAYFHASLCQKNWHDCLTSRAFHNI